MFFNPGFQIMTTSNAPIHRFLAEHQQKKWAIIFGISCLIFAIIAQILTIRALQQKSHIFVIDGAQNLHVGPLETINSNSPIFQTLALTATQVIFNRSPVGLDLPELKEHLFTEEAAKLLDQNLLENLETLKSKNLHQKAEIATIKTIAEQKGLRYLHVRGNILGAGNFEGMPIVETQTFQLNLVLKPNPKLSEQKMYPFLVADFYVQELDPL